MAVTTTYSFNLPTVGGDFTTWGGLLNANWSLLDDYLDGTQTLSGTVLDDTISLVDNVDVTKVAQFQLSGITTATTRTFTLPDASGTLALADATLTSIAALGTAADKGVYFTGVDTAAEFDLTAAGRALLDDANAAAQRTTLGLGTAATRAAEAILTNGSNLPDGAAVTAAIAAAIAAISLPTGHQLYSPDSVYTDVTGSFVAGTAYENTTPYLMLVNAETLNGGRWEVSADGSTGWTTAAKPSGSDRHLSSFIVRPGWFYRSQSFASVSSVFEYAEI